MWENKPTKKYYQTNQQEKKKKKKLMWEDRQPRNVLVFLKESLEARRHRYKSICEVGITHSDIDGFTNVSSNTLILTSGCSPVKWNKNHEVGRHRILKNIISTINAVKKKS